MGDKLGFTVTVDTFALTIVTIAMLFFLKNIARPTTSKGVLSLNTTVYW